MPFLIIQLQTFLLHISAYCVISGMVPAAQKGNLAVQWMLHVALQNLISQILFCQ